MTDRHPIAELDETVHQRVRLGILVVLAEVPHAEFTEVRKLLGVTDGNLTTHVGVLETAGYVAVEKTFRGRRPLTLLRITAAGRRALQAEREILERLLAALLD